MKTIWNYLMEDAMPDYKSSNKVKTSKMKKLERSCKFRKGVLVLSIGLLLLFYVGNLL